MQRGHRITVVHHLVGKFPGADGSGGHAGAGAAGDITQAAGPAGGIFTGGDHRKTGALTQALVVVVFGVVREGVFDKTIVLGIPTAAPTHEVFIVQTQHHEGV